jgi:hypothetical protein
MRLSAPDFRYRAQLTELMDEPCSRDVLRACLRDIARTNQWTFAYRPLLHWLNSITASLPALNEPLRILDVGCGYEYLRSWRGFIILCNTMDLFPSRAPL